ncbi:MAG: hypothetical protein ACRYFX_21585 [Janthinobacterium lividum]
MSYQIGLTNLLNWAVLPTTSPPEELFADPELLDAQRWASALPAPEQREVLVALDEQLPGLDPAKASALLVLGGGLVETGADPTALLPGGLQHLHYLRELQEAGQPPAPDLWRFTVMGLMAMVCRSAEARAQLRQQADLVQWLEAHEELSDHFSYLLHLAATSDEAALWILLPDCETGLEISISQVNNTFHLLTLVQPLMRDLAADLKLRHYPAATSPALLRFAQGDYTAESEDTDYARFEWLTSLAYQGGPFDHLQMAWGEMRVSDWPRLRGHVVLLAAESEKRISRSWDRGFLESVHDANQPAVHLRRLLPAAEVRELLAELHPPVAPAA